ncbi:MAG: hypothetical protein AAF215_03765 [Cyanobacteria bacterium P01_A01_bin.123]
MVLQVRPTQQSPTITWEALPADYVLPDNPVENIQQPALAAALTDALEAAGFVQPTAQQQAAQERQRAEVLAARLRELGIDPEAD